MIDAEEVDWEREYNELSPVRCLSAVHMNRVNELASRVDETLYRLNRCVRLHHQKCVSYGGPIEAGDGAYKFNMEINHEARIASGYGTRVSDSVRGRLRDNNIATGEFSTVCTILETTCSVLLVQTNIIEYFYRFRKDWHSITNTIIKRARRQYDCFEDCLNWVMGKLKMLPCEHPWLTETWNAFNYINPLSWLIRLGWKAWHSVTATASFSDAFVVTAKGAARYLEPEMASEVVLALTNDLKTILTHRVSVVFQCTPSQISDTCFCSERLYGIGSVVQLSCACSRRLHKKCFRDWARTTHILPTSCPYCRESPVEVKHTLRY